MLMNLSGFSGTQGSHLSTSFQKHLFFYIIVFFTLNLVTDLTVSCIFFQGVSIWELLVEESFSLSLCPVLSPYQGKNNDICEIGKILSFFLVLSLFLFACP